MTDKRIITKKEKNYIETLYLYLDIENVSILEKKEVAGNYAYFNVLSYMNDNMFPSAVCLGESKGRTWYQFPNYRLGLMGYDTAKNANQFNCVIQYEQHHLWTLDNNLTCLDLPFDIDLKYYHIKRIDVTKIAKHDEDYLTNYDFISPYRRNDRVNGTVYLGHRDNANVFRMYNKTRELLTDTKKHPINYKKIALLSEYFGDIENLWTYELELSRSFLKGSLGIETLADLSKVWEANNNIVSKIRFYKNNDKNKRLVRSGNRDRIKCRVLTDYKEFDRVNKKHYKPSFGYAVDKMVSTVDRYIDSMGIEKNNDIYMKFANAFLSRRVSQKNKDLLITFEDTVLSHEIDEMTVKHTLMRDNQSNELEKEAERAFI